MMESSSSYIQLATRDGFNSSVRHINRTLDLLDSCNPKNNIADEVNALIETKMIDTEEVQSAINMLLVEKWKYSFLTRNITGVPLKISAIVEETAKWKGIDLVIGYHHPDIGFIIINPKNPESAALISGFRKNELAVLYAGTQSADTMNKKNAELALSLLLDLLEDKTVKTPASLINGSFVFTPPKKAVEKKIPSPKTKATRQVKAPVRQTAYASSSSTMNNGASSMPSAPAVEAAPARPVAPPPVAAPSSSRMSSLNSVPVTNELFHNGNVEAWKRIIRSYNAKYPNLQVFIYYDGERIVDINTLFKWGKVKHGSCIQFCVSGENIQDLAKLSRYFRQGASSQFEAFLHGSPDTVMTLF